MLPRNHASGSEKSKKKSAIKSQKGAIDIFVCKWVWESSDNDWLVVKEDNLEQSNEN